MMVHCNSCSSEISSNAKTCPHCGQPDPYTQADADLDTAIRKHVEKQMSKETYVLIGFMCIGVVLGLMRGGCFGAFLGFVAGAILALVINKVLGWFA